MEFCAEYLDLKEKTFAGNCMKCQSEWDTYGDTMIKHLSLLIVFLMTLGSQVNAATVYQCTGTVGNGYDHWKPEYKVYANRTITFAIQCNLWQRYAEGGANCGANWNGIPMPGYYLGSGNTEVFRFKPENSGPFQGGKFDVSTSTVVFRVGDTNIGATENERQRWFNGRCIKS